jgi:threonine/homoserine/homoserine lactone efflux protein
MHDLPALFGMLAALTVGVVSPGPSFVMVARTAVAHSRTDGVCAALGMGIGGLAFAAAALLGLHGLLLAVPSLYIGLKLVGGLYLAYLGLRIWRSARQPLGFGDEALRVGKSTAGRSLLHGLITQLSNPKAAIVYASVFAAFLPAAPTLGFDFAVVALVFVVESSWYALVAVALSSQRPRGAYLSYKAWIDRSAGGIMVALGLKLLASAQRP